MHTKKKYGCGQFRCPTKVSESGKRIPDAEKSQKGCPRKSGVHHYELLTKPIKNEN